MEQDNITINVYHSIIICVPRFFNSLIILVVDTKYSATNIDTNTVYVYCLAFHLWYVCVYVPTLSGLNQNNSSNNPCSKTYETHF